MNNRWVESVDDAVEIFGKCEFHKKSLIIMESPTICKSFIEDVRKVFSPSSIGIRAKIDFWEAVDIHNNRPFCYIYPLCLIEKNSSVVFDFKDVYFVGEKLKDIKIFGKELTSVNKKPHKKLPPLAVSLCHDCDGWIVGSTADYVAGKDSDLDGCDLDIVIPAKHWNSASHICTNADEVSINSFGGLKCVSKGVTIDVWMDDVADLMAHHHVKVAFHPQSRTYISREKL